MALDSKKLLDSIGWQLLIALQENARLSFAELGRRVNLSLPAVAERVRRLEEAGIISGYRADINTKKIGLPVTAFIRLHTSHTQYPAFLSMVEKQPEVVECHHLAGVDSFLIKVVVADVEHLETLIGGLSTFGQTTTSIVLSSPVTRQSVSPKLVSVDT